MAVTLRNITENDLELIRAWRMDPDITRYMNTNPKLTLEGQKKWLSSINQREDVRHWLVEIDGQPAGTINIADINWDEKNTSWGYYIGEKKLRSLKTVLSLEMSLYDYVFEVLEFDELHNEVFSLNQGVIKLHEGCGSRIVNEVKGEVVKEGVAYDVTHISITAEEWKRIKPQKRYESINFELGYAVDHIGYAVSNIESAIAIYTKNGFDIEIPKIHDEARGINIAFIKNRTDGVRIELIEPVSDNNDVSATLHKMNYLSVPYHICYKVDNIDRAIKEFCCKKYVLTTKTMPAMAMNNRRVAFLIRKEAGIIELVEQDN